jgi:predicted secreted hydrolase
MRRLAILSVLAACASEAAVDAPLDAMQDTPTDTLLDASVEVARECNPTPAGVSLPADDAPHPGGYEWWYYTGHVESASGARYGYELTIFQGYAGTVLGFPAHFAVTDFQKGVHVYDQKLFIGPQEEPKTFDLAVDDWTISGDGTADRIHGTGAGYAFTLTCTPTKPAAFHGKDGLVEMGGGKVSWYYSKTRMDVAGMLATDGVEQAVTGTGWMDHQWGDFDVFLSNGWDWFSLQLDDGTDLMAYFLHFKDKPTGMTGATVVDPDGCSRTVDVFDAVATGSWHSPHTDADYPQGWTISVPAEGIELTVTTAVADQEMDTWATTYNTYWEGAVDVTGTHHGAEVKGQGYVELAGYGPWGPQE